MAERFTQFQQIDNLFVTHFVENAALEIDRNIPSIELVTVVTETNNGIIFLTTAVGFCDSFHLLYCGGVHTQVSLVAFTRSDLPVAVNFVPLSSILSTVPFQSTQLGSKRFEGAPLFRTSITPSITSRG